MFTLYDLLDSYEVPESERNRMFRRVNQFAQTENGEWLNAINWRGVNLKWALGMMTRKKSVLGCYVFKSNTIYLQPEDVYNSGKGSQWPELMVPTLIHELRHKWQYERNRLAYRLLCWLPILRKWTLERDAEKITKKADEFCEEMDRVEAAAEYERKQAEKKKRGNK